MNLDLDLRPLIDHFQVWEQKFLFEAIKNPTNELLDHIACLYIKNDGKTLPYSNVRKIVEIYKDFNEKTGLKFTEQNLKNISIICKSSDWKNTNTYKNMIKKFFPGFIKKSSKISLDTFLENHEILSRFSRSLKSSNPELFKFDEVKLLFKLEKKPSEIKLRANYYKSFKRLSPKLVSSNIEIVNWNYLIENNKPIPEEYKKIFLENYSYYVDRFSNEKTSLYLFRNIEGERIPFALSTYRDNLNILCQYLLELTESDFSESELGELINLVRILDDSNNNNKKLFLLLNKKSRNDMLAYLQLKEKNQNPVSYLHFLEGIKTIISECFLSKEYREYLSVLKEYLPKFSGPSIKYVKGTLKNIPELYKYFSKDYIFFDTCKKNISTTFFKTPSLFIPDFFRDNFEEKFRKLKEDLKNLENK